MRKLDPICKALIAAVSAMPVIVTAALFQASFIAGVFAAVGFFVLALAIAVVLRFAE